MDQKMNIPPYIIKQIIAGTLYERKNDLVQKAKRVNNQPQKKQSEVNTIKNYIETAMSTQEMATQIRIGNIPLEQCIAELTEDERKIVFSRCKDWYEENREKSLEEKEY